MDRMEVNEQSETGDHNDEQEKEKEEMEMGFCMTFWAARELAGMLRLRIYWPSLVRVLSPHSQPQVHLSLLITKAYNCKTSSSLPEATQYPMIIL
jgi:hypothetical protein